MIQFVPSSFRLAILLPGQHPNWNDLQRSVVPVVACFCVVLTRGAGVVGQLLPSGSRLESTVELGQHPYLSFSHDSSVVVVVGLVTTLLVTFSVLAAVVLGLVVFMTGGLVTFWLVVTGQLLPSASRCTVFVPWQHPNVVMLHISTVVVDPGGVVVGLVSLIVMFATVVFTGQLLPV